MTIIWRFDFGLDHGSVVGQGTHKELLAPIEVYQEMPIPLSKEELEHA